VYGLARAGRPQAEALLDSVRRQAQHAPKFSRATWQEVALPACEGLHSYALGDYDHAWHRLALALPRLAEVGGSHAQRDLFEQILLDSALRGGRLVAAQQMLERRRGADPDGVPVNQMLAAVYAKLGLPALAEQARRRAASTRARYASRSP
jgi:predicted Zn-dependent protease